MQLLQLLLKASRNGVLFATLLGIVSGICNAVALAIINLALQDTSLDRRIITLAFLVTCFFMLISMAFSQMYLSRVAEKIVFELRLRLIRRILNCPLRHLEEMGIPRILATLTQDIEAVANASISITALGLFLALLLGCLVYLCWLSVPLFVLTLVLMPLGIFSNQYLVYLGKRFFVLAREEQDNLFRHFRTATEGIKELKLHRQRRQAFLLEDFQETAASYKINRVKAIDYFAWGGSWGLVALFILIGIILFVIPTFFKIPNSILSGYVITLVFALTPIRGILNTFPEFIRANIALEKINSLGLSLAKRGTEIESALNIPPKPNWQSLEFKGVSHAYRSERDDNHFTLGPIDLTLSPGEILFIIGGNGSGKSTLVKLIAGLYLPEGGTIELDGEKITPDNLDEYRQQFSVIFSDFYLFDRLLGLEPLEGDRQAQLYLKQLQLDRKVKLENGKFSTISLSQGQRKRLALLTAYLEDRAIFVFDEWASDQDPAFKKVFYTQLLPDLKQRGKSIIVVSHDDHYFEQADRVLKLDYGTIEYDKRLHL